MKSAPCFLFLLFSTSAFAQGNAPSVINAGGGSSAAGYFHFEWSIGELSLINQMNGPNNSLIVTNGFIQPYTLYPTVNNPYTYFGGDEIKVFPSPASSYVEINFFTRQKGKLLAMIYDAAGRKVWMKELQSNGVDLIERIPVTRFASGIYALHINLEAEPGFISKKGIYKITKVN